MDIFSHALWGGGLFGYRNYFWWAIFFGAFPDLASFGLFAIVRVVDGTFILGPPPLDIIPSWLFFSYDLTHSFITAFVVIGIMSLWKKFGIRYVRLAISYLLRFSFSFSPIFSN